MKCYNCGCTLSEDDFCTACGADVRVYKKIVHLSNAYYNDGLQKARVRDLSGAIQSLKQSLKCNRNHIPARNLLGLIYFERGDSVAALSEWVISKSIRSKKNVAEKYISDIQNNPNKLNTLSQAIKKFNQSLLYCEQGSYDLAIIQLKRVLQLNSNYVEAQQLLGLLYINQSEWNKAYKVLKSSLAIDANNTRTLSYMKEVESKVGDKESHGLQAAGRKPPKALVGVDSNEVIAYKSGNETIIQPLNTRQRNGSQTFLNIIIGLAFGLAISWFLIIPARMQASLSENNSQIKDVSTALTNKSADMDDLKQQISALENENKTLEANLSEYTGNTGIMQDYNNLLKAAKTYISNPDEVLETAGYLEQISAVSVNAVNGSVTTSGNNVSNEFMSLYNYLNDDVSAKAVSQYLSMGTSEYNNGDYEAAIKNLTSAFELEPTSDTALYYLAQSYLKSDDKDTATKLFNQLISDFPDSKYKNRAQRFIDSGEEDNSKASSSSGTQAQTQTNTLTPEQAAALQQQQAAAAAAALQQQQAAAAAAAAAAAQQQVPQ